MEHNEGQVQGKLPGYSAHTALPRGGENILFNGATTPYLQNCWQNLLEHTESTFNGNVYEKQLQLLKILVCQAKIKMKLSHFFFLFTD